ncbi:MAG: hypothetical protein IJ571_00195 [Ruminococcus sp.]|nr:hypothetical protein [Ruminococcus sp.]
MGAYATPSNRSFRTTSKIKAKRKNKTRLDRNAEMLKGSKMILDKKNGRIVMVKNNEQ